MTYSKSTRRVSACFFGVGVALCAATATLAELPSIRFDRLSPLGASAGTTAEAEIAGADIEDVKSLLFDHPGLKAEFVKDQRFKITIAPDVPAGTYDVRLIGRFGVSNPRLFAVSHGLTDIAETEPNNEPSQAQIVSINSAINGMSDGNGEDTVRFAAKRGQRLAIECQAGKLDSMLDAELSLTSATGQLLAASGDYFGRDPFLDFVAPEDGDYVVRVNDLSYRGGFPYRLLITDLPHIENIFPRAVEAGKSVDVQVLGRNLGTAAKPSGWKIDGLALDELRATIRVPDDFLGAGSYRFFEHPTDHTVLPTAATCTLSGYQIAPELGRAAFRAQPLVVSDTPVTIELESNDSRDSAQQLALPAVVSGRFDRSRDADWFEIEPPENASYSFEVYSERIAGRADPYVVVIDDQGNRVGELDDYGHRTNAFDGHLRDPSGSISLTGKKKYRVLVQDRYGRGGARFQYVLTVRKPVPDFFAAVIHSQNPGPGGCTVGKGGAAYLDVIIHQRDGYGGPVTITADGLPPGLHAGATTINNDQRGTFVLWADESAAEWTGTIKLFAEGRRGDTTFRREVRPYSRVWTDPNMNSSRPTREVAVAIRDSAPFSLRLEPESVTVESGKKVDLKLEAKRHWRDFNAKIAVLPLSFKGNFQMPTIEVAAGAGEATATINVSAGTPPGDYTMSILGQAQVPFSKDPQAINRPATLVSLPSRPVTIRVVDAKK
jgi:hypothetical protein